jgi:hypothetical protein
MEIQLTPDEYQGPEHVHFGDPAQETAYRAAHREAWLAFTQTTRTTITEDGRPRGMAPGRGSFERAFTSEAERAGFDAGFKAAVTLHFQRVQEAVDGQQRERQGTWTSPIGPVDRCDLIEETAGGVNLTILATRPLDTDPRTVKALETKLRLHCKYVKHPSFEEEFGLASEERVQLILRSDWEVPQALVKLMVRVAEEEQAPVQLVLEHE